MSFGTLIYHFIVANCLTLYYNATVLLYFAYHFIKNPFSDPWAMKIKLEPPSQLTDPRYGVHKYTKVNNIMMHYVQSGDPSKPLMVFVHGFPEFWYSWRHQILEFKKDYCCVAVDMRGYADSEKPEGVSSYHIDLLVEDIRDLVRHLGREKFTLVSHDWGGLISCRYHELYPETLDAIVVLASLSVGAWYSGVWGSAEQRHKSWYVFMYRAPAIPEKLLQMYDLEMFDKAMLVPGKDSITKEDVQCYKYWFRKQYTLTPPINYYRANFLYTIPEVKKYETKVPFLLCQAADDLYISRSSGEKVKEQYKNVELVYVENCGHFLQQEEPEKVNGVIREFLKRHNVL